MARRDVRFQSLDDVIADVENLLDKGYRRTGNWNLGQLVEHLDRTTKMGMDGTAKRMPWILRVTMGKYFVRAWLKRGTMGTDMPTSPDLIPQSASSDDDVFETPTESDRVQAEQFIATTRRAIAFTGPLPPHPLVNHLSLEDWKKLTLIHANHHLRFLHPLTPS